MENIIKKTEHLTLIELDPYEDVKKCFQISIKYSDTLCIIATIFQYVNELTCIRSYGTNLQDCITTWELYKEFIMLVDEAYERIDLQA